MRPKIGITKSIHNFNPAYWAIFLSVFFSGAEPIALEPNGIIDRDIDGLLVGGGTDIYPKLYQAEPVLNYLYDDLRDDTELVWLDYAEKKDIPVLGICRGAQLLNVANGGTLHRDVREAYEDAIYPSGYLAYMTFRKLVVIKEGSKIHEIIGKESYKVNSMHKQSIDQLGEGLMVTAQEVNGVVQVIEKQGKDFYIGLQFHPELMMHRSRCRKIFQTFVEICKKAKKKKSELFFFN